MDKNENGPAAAGAGARASAPGLGRSAEQMHFNSAGATSGDSTATATTGSDPAAPEGAPLTIATWLLEQVHGLDEELRDKHLYVQQLMACRGGNRKESDTARTALAHWRLKSNELEADRLSIESKLADKVELLRPTLVKLLDQLIWIELLTIDRDQAIDAEVRQAAKRSGELRTGLYSMARGVVDRLYEDHDVAEGVWSTVSEEGLARLAEVLWRESRQAGLGSPLAPALRNKTRARRSR